MLGTPEDVRVDVEQLAIRASTHSCDGLGDREEPPGEVPLLPALDPVPQARDHSVDVASVDARLEQLIAAARSCP